MELQYKIMASANKPKATKQDVSCTIGVGDGSGEHYVHGDYDSIKLLQGKLIKLSELCRYVNEVGKALKEYNDTL